MPHVAGLPQSEELQWRKTSTVLRPHLSQHLPCFRISNDVGPALSQNLRYHSTSTITAIPVCLTSIDIGCRLWEYLHYYRTSPVSRTLNVAGPPLDRTWNSSANLRLQELYWHRVHYSSPSNVAAPPLPQYLHTLITYTIPPPPL